jgi:hypothetical protein
MLKHLLLGVAVLTFGFVGTPAFSQDVDVDVDVQDGPSGHPMLFIGGGGNNSLVDLQNDDEFDIDSDFNTGYNLSGGLGIQLNRWAALRGVYTYSRAEGEGAALSPIANNEFNRHYYGADLQFRADMDSGFSPYFFVGGGAVTVDPSDNAVLLSPSGARFSNESFTKPAGRFGLGFEYQFPDTGFGIFAEGSGWVYNFDRYGFDRTQVDTNWGGGLTYRFGY